MATQVLLELRLTLRPGTVYYFQHRGLTSAEPHYFIVVNSNPLRDEVLLLAVASSRVERVRLRRRFMPPETLVEVTPVEYEELCVPSLVDCNRVFRKSLAELVQEHQRGLVKPKKDFPPALLTRIQAGIKASPMVEEEAKALIN